jgi:predicted nucleotidyltransferase
MEGDWSHLLRPSGRRVVNLLLSGPRTLTELAAETGLTKPSLLPTLRQLAMLGIVERTEIRTPEGRATSYRLLSASLHVEVRGEGVAVSWATTGPVPDDFPLAAQVEDPLIRSEALVALRSLRSGLPQAMPTLFIVLYGSAAAGQTTWKSDIDLLVVMRDEDVDAWENVVDRIADVQHLVTHAVRAEVTGRTAFLAGKSKIEREAAERGLVLWGPREVNELWQRMERHRSISL